MFTVLRATADSRLAFRVYAAIAIVGGVSVVGAGIRGIPYPYSTLPAVPYGRASLIYVTGMIAVAMGLAAAGFTRVDDPDARRRALYLFATGHLLVGLLALMQWEMFWRDLLPSALPSAPLVAGAGLLACALAASYAAAHQEPGTARRIRSRYDEQIRQAARVEERARLARDLHDAVKQQLFVIHTAAATAQARLDADPGGVREALEHVRSAAREATTEMEALLDELQARPLENVGLVEALRKQCEALQFRTGARVTMDVGDLPASTAFPPGAQDAVYRVAQEALANVGRHARASEVTVHLSGSTHSMELRVGDNGQGFDTNAARTGMGQRNMAARAAEVGATLKVDTARDRGTVVTLRLPLGASASGAHLRTAGLLALILLFLVVLERLAGMTPSTPYVLTAVGVLLLGSLFQAYRALKQRPSA